MQAHICTNGTRVVIHETWTEVTLPNGKMVSGVPQHTAEQAETARRLGYGGDVDALCRDHDPLHALLADWLGINCSYSMREAAGELMPGNKLAALEETAVLAVQEYLRKAGGRLPL